MLICGDTATLSTMAHEMGHNLGFDHATAHGSVMSQGVPKAPVIQPWEVDPLRMWWVSSSRVNAQAG